MPTVESFGVELRRLRDLAKLLQREAAVLLECRKNTYARWERGVLIPPPLVQEGALARMRAVAPTDARRAGR